MVLDTSAVVCILFQEAEAKLFARQIADDEVRLMSMVSVYESALVVESRKGAEGAVRLDTFLSDTGIVQVPFMAPHLQLAREAYRRFGKGRHPAALNLGDCAAYALARWSGEPLLFKGSDFSRTDIQAVLPV